VAPSQELQLLPYPGLPLQPQGGTPLVTSSATKTSRDGRLVTARGPGRAAQDPATSVRRPGGADQASPNPPAAALRDRAITARAVSVSVRLGRWSVAVSAVAAAMLAPAAKVSGNPASSPVSAVAEESAQAAAVATTGLACPATSTVIAVAEFASTVSVPIDHLVESTQQIAARPLLVSRGSFTVPPPLYSLTS
jgi:hypothetical protein